MRNVNTWLSILLVGILMTTPLGYTAAESSDFIYYQGVKYKVIPDAQFWNWFCEKNPEDQRCINRRNRAVSIPAAFKSQGEIENTGTDVAVSVPAAPEPNPPIANLPDDNGDLINDGGKGGSNCYEGG